MRGWCVRTGKVHVRNTIEQLKLVGPRSLGVALLTAGFVGMVFTIQVPHHRLIRAASPLRACNKHAPPHACIFPSPSPGARADVMKGPYKKQHAHGFVFVLHGVAADAP